MVYNGVKSFKHEFKTLAENLAEWIVYQTKSPLLGIVILETTRTANPKSRGTRTVSQEHPDILITLRKSHCFNMFAFPLMKVKVKQRQLL